MKLDLEFLYTALRKVRDIRVRARGEWVKNANKRSAMVIGFLLLAVALIYLFVLRAPDDFPIGDIVTIEPGSSLSAVTKQLGDEHIVRFPLLLRALVTLEHGDASVVAGDYQFSNASDVFTIAHLITTGTFGLVPVKIRIPEGSSTIEMAAIFSKLLPRFHSAEFLKESAPLEGYLFPDTYFFLPNADEKVVIRTMLSNFEIQIAKVQPQIDAYGKPLSDVITMASLLEKEARIPTDRQKIAGLLWRRISIGMPLQVDAAFLYILGRTTFDLSMKDLQTDSPYNTYRYKGLPPGPIDSPGLESIQAAVTPIDTGALFYLADNNGVTHFSKTYAQHLQNKALYLGN
jgi:UPF0755 protein